MVNGPTWTQYSLDNIEIQGIRYALDPEDEYRYYVLDFVGRTGSVANSKLAKYLGITLKHLRTIMLNNNAIDGVSYDPGYFKGERELIFINIEDAKNALYELIQIPLKK